MDPGCIMFKIISNDYSIEEPASAFIIIQQVEEISPGLPSVARTKAN